MNMADNMLHSLNEMTIVLYYFLSVRRLDFDNSIQIIIICVSISVDREIIFRRGSVQIKIFYRYIYIYIYNPILSLL